MKYDVHVYAVVRIKVPGIEAESPSEAAKMAEELTDFIAAVRSSQYADMIDDFVVDQLDDDGNVVASLALDGEYNVLAK
jgi:hypothetical protein